ncbi:hypothetical protein GH5_01542 [Leishmania sp. Ghana 2012 LV757]|uniref:hypothetical protein n=1 Tax=Leishmania sp. Ghana 2012 LV757 TaxID=2803181 RepID=UPI001B4B4EB8|nr:hypothetical protein GH5_01542 [Leishmania sp. Ghana 2012 LV757]
MATVASVSVPRVEVDASSPHELYRRLVCYLVDCTVEVVNPGALTASVTSYTRHLSALRITLQPGSRGGVHVDWSPGVTVLGIPQIGIRISGYIRPACEGSPSHGRSHDSTAHSGHTALGLSRSRAVLVTNGLCNTNVRESKA